MPNIKWSTKITLLLVSSLTILSIITISPALPGIVTYFSTIENIDFLAKLVLTIPALFIAVTAPIAGRLIDRYGRIKLLWAALLLYAISGMAGFISTTIYQLLVSRIFLGIAVGMSMTIVVTLVGDYFEGIARQQFLGIQVAFMSAGGIIFIGLGGVLADISWQYPFILYGLALLVLPLAIFYLKEPELKSGEVANIKDLKIPRFVWLLCLNTMFMWILFFFIPVQIPFYLAEMGIQQKALIGGAIATSTAFSTISAFAYSFLKKRFHFTSIFLIGYLLMAIGFYIIAIANTYFLVLLAMMFSGLGMGMMIPNTNMWIMQLVPPAIRGQAIGRLTTFWFLGQFLSPFFIALLLQFVLPEVTFKLAAGCLFILAITFGVMQKRNQP